MTREARRPISRTKGKKKRKDEQNHRIFNKIVHREFCLSLKAVYMNFAKVCSFFCIIRFCSISLPLVMISLQLYSSQIPIQNPDIPSFFLVKFTKMNFILNCIHVTKYTFSFIHRDRLGFSISSSFY